MRLSTIWIFAFLFFNSFRLFGQLPEDFFDQTIRSDFNFVLGLTFDQSGQLYLWEKQGKVIVIDTTGQRVAEPLIDISEEVCNWKDHGLMSLALDPNFEKNGYLYVIYAVDLHHYFKFGTPEYSPDSMTINAATFGRVERFQADVTTNFQTLIPNSRKILLGETIENGIPLINEFHGLGTIVAGEDGTLLISVGDAASGKGADIGGDTLGAFVTQALNQNIITPEQDIGSYRAQFRDSYNGKILRIDASTGDGLPSNPFFDAKNPRSPMSRVWSMGLRNPYRIMVLPETGGHAPEEGNPGVILAGDVGWGAWEELNVIKSGGQNFGWPITEGYIWTWSFFIKPTPQNKLAPNPMFGQGGCDQPYFNFRDLFSWPKSDPNNIKFNNPCGGNQTITEAQGAMVITLPEIAWSNAQWNKPARANIPTYNENDDVVGITLSEENAYVKGEDFGGFSTMAGLVYNGTLYPEKYQNKVFFMDHMGWIKIFEFDESQKLLEVKPFHDEVKEILHLAQNPKDGALYYVNLKNELHKIDYGGNPPPQAIIELDQQFGPSPLTVEFKGGASISPKSTIVSYQWDFGTGETSTEVNPTIVFGQGQSDIQKFDVKLVVTDSLGDQDSTTTIVSLNNSPPKVNINSVAFGDLYPIDQTSLLRLAAEVEDQEHAAASLSYQWKVYLHHNDHFHPEPILTTQDAFALVSPLGCEEDIYWYRILLEVSDPEGLKGRDERLIYPYCGDPFLTWSDLMGQASLEQVNLEWTTQEEKDVIAYEIQRSHDYFHFERLGTIDAKGPGLYQYQDLNPLNGLNLYRIKAISKDRAFVYSNLESVQYPAFPDIYLYPNPATNEFKVSVKKSLDPLVKISIFNPIGQLVFQRSWESVVGVEVEQVVDVQNWQNGVYFYILENGSQSKKGNLMIAK